MSLDIFTHFSPAKMIQVLQSIADADITTWLAIMSRFIDRHITARFQAGMYEVLDYQAQLELKDEKGKDAIFSKQERVRFLQDNVIAYQDQAWGNGNIFADYKCSPGIAVDHYEEGNRYRILISLRETKHRRDVEIFHIQRRIHNGFTKETEYFQTRVDHKTRHLSMIVIFPRKRFPKDVALVEANANRITPLSTEHAQVLPDGRQQVSWEMKMPRRFETYSLRWQW